VKKSSSKERETVSASRLIDARIEELGDWRGEMLSRIRSLIKEAGPEVVEKWQWGRGVRWLHAGIICTGETHKTIVRIVFARGASLEDPSALFNSSFESKYRRAIDFREGDRIDEEALKTLIRTAVALNNSSLATLRIHQRAPKKPPEAFWQAIMRRISIELRRC
jgi:hypothetical protein